MPERCYGCEFILMIHQAMTVSIPDFISCIEIPQSTHTIFQISQVQKLSINQKQDSCAL